MEIQLKIKGMSCQHCVNHTQQKLAEVAGVKSVQIDLAAGTARVQGDDLDEQALIEAVKAAGYQAEVSKN